MSGVALVQALSRAALALPPVKGLGLILEYASRAFSRWDIDVPTRLFGSRIYGNPSVTDRRRMLFTARYHDQRERDFVESILRPGDYAIDVGANIGLYTLLFARLVGPSGKVTAIEAEPTNFADLNRNLALNGYANVTAHHKGAAPTRGTLMLHLNDVNLGMHSFVIDQGSGDVEVDCFPLTELVEPIAPRLLKIDIEGFEYPVLAQYFSNAALLPDYILLEDWPEARLGDVPQLCLDHGYEKILEYTPNLIFRRR